MAQSEITRTIDEYLVTKSPEVRPKTMKWYRMHMSHFDTWCKERGYKEIREITAPVVAQAGEQSGYTNTNSQHGYIQCIKGFLTWCSADPDLGVRALTLQRIKLPKAEQSEIEIFTPGEVKKLLACAKEGQNPIRDTALILLLLDTGIRVSEACYDSARPDENTGLKLHQVYLKNARKRNDTSFITVIGKGRKERSINLGEEADAALRRYINRSRPRVECEHVFLSQRLQPLSIHMVEHQLKAWGKQCGIEDTHPHKFRHTFAVNSLLNGLPEHLLMRLMGHTSHAALEIYLRSITQMQARERSTSTADKYLR